MCTPHPDATSFAQVLKDFLTPQVFKQAHRANLWRARENKKRWHLQPLLTVLVLLTWTQGDSLPEKFEVARACYVALHPKRRQPGQTFSGFQKALARLPMPVLHALVVGVRGQVARWLAGCWRTDGFVLLGCDGSRRDCPRTAAMEKGMGYCAKKRKRSKGGAEMSQPAMWLTALVHLASGVPWAWLWGKGNASEQRHLERLTDTLPADALVITDAGYRGFDLLVALRRHGAHFLIRLSSVTTVYTLEHRRVRHFNDGQVVYYWPAKVQRSGKAPVKGRLIRIPGRKRGKDVWLLTSVLEPARLSVAQASRYYRLRWGSEGFFRTYKRTLHQWKVQFDTPRLAFREAEVGMLATQILLCQGARAVPAVPATPQPACSPRGVLRVFRREIERLAAPRRRQRFAKELAQAQCQRRPRQSPKQKRSWPRRKEHKAPKPPKILTLSKEQKARLLLCEPAA